MVTLLLLAAFLPGADDEAKSLGQAEFRQAAVKGLAFLDAGGAELEKGSSCLNCHHAPLRNFALWEASRVGIPIDTDALTSTTSSQLKRLADLKDDYRDKQWGHSLSAFYLMGGREGTQPVDKAAANELVQIILAEQSKEGSWKAAQQFGNQRRPNRDANEAQTLWTVLALTRVEQSDETTAARDRALKWLADTEPGSTVDSRALRILVEHKLGKPERRDELLAKFLQTQQPDGGWGWQPTDPSDAWGTGLALYVLGSLGDKAPAEAINTGQAFLATTQKEDGSWLVEGKLTKSPKMASYFGSAWAIVGISSTLPK